MKPCPVLLQGLVLLALAAPLRAAEPAPGESGQPGQLGRLFFTPAERAALDRQRLTNKSAGGSGSRGTQTINGQVRKSSGAITTWINGETYDGAPHPGAQVGETIDPESNGRLNGLNGGSIVIRPPRRGQ